MLVDLLSPANYIMINRDAIKILGLNTAVYCSELLTIYKKVVNKKKFVDNDGYFQVDRDYIEKQTSLDIETQLKCDINLAKVNIVKINSENPNIIYFDAETFGSVLAAEDIKILNNVSAKVKVDNPKGAKAAKGQYVVQALKNSIEFRNPDIVIKLYDWIDTIFATGKGLSKPQVKIFQDKLNAFCDGDVEKGLKVMDIAIAHAYQDCDWAINLYNRDVNFGSSAPTTNTRVTMVSEQRRTTKVSEESF